MTEINDELLRGRRAVTILKQMYNFYEENSLCNVDLIVGKNRFPTHKLILMSNNDFFKNNINVTTTEIILEGSQDILAESVKKAIKFFYLGQVDMRLDQIRNIIEFCKMIQACELEGYCEKYLEKIIDSKNVFFIENIAKEYGYLQLFEQTKFYVASNYLEVIQGEEFFNISCDRLCELLQFDELNVIMEEQVLTGLKMWVLHDYESRKTHLNTLMKHIRWRQFSIEFLIKEVKPLCYDSFYNCQLLLDVLESSYNPEMGSELSWLVPTRRNIYKETMLIVGGMDRTNSSEIETWNPIVNKWSTFYNLNSNTCWFETVLLDNKLMMISGIILIEPTNKVFCLDLMTKEITELKEIQQARQSFKAAVMDGQVFVFGGCFESYEHTLNSVERYDPGTNTWTYMAAMSTQRYSHEIAVVGMEVYVIGGYSGTNVFNTMEIYDRRQNKWTAAPPMKVERMSFAAVTLGDHIYAIGGRTIKKIESSVERFDIKTQTWTSVASLPRSMCGHRAVVFDGRILCIGSSSPSIMEYDPSINKWKEHDMPTPKLRSSFSLIFVPMALLNNE
ncbi:kelch-like protein 5 [Arctopsyche grandis]|uniref:kelch-like protein 5 n=1 Tax=Arctopsyche grandis TaxID=121162 RepID=UPI00406D9584